MNAPLPALVSGGTISAIIPQSIEETWRLSTMIVEAGLAPQALIGREPRENASDDEWKRWGKKGTSAVAIVMMSGAELGLPPMVSLRSFTVIGGKPALYGDGLINVVRRSKKAEYVRTGYDADTKSGWCEARRADTGEEKRVEFSEDDARRAGLWDEKTTRRGKVWRNGQQVWDDVPNDSTWFRYPQRMLAWRAAGYCLRELFADVLGGIRDEFEAREAEGDFIEHDEPPARIAAPTPPAPPQPPRPPSAQNVETIEVITPEGDEVEAPGEIVDAIDYGDYFERLDEALKGCADGLAVEEVWNDFDAEATFEGDADSYDLAFNLKTRRLSQLSPLGGG